MGCDPTLYMPTNLHSPPPTFCVSPTHLVLSMPISSSLRCIHWRVRGPPSSGNSTKWTMSDTCDSCSEHSCNLRVVSAHLHGEWDNYTIIKHYGNIILRTILLPENALYNLSETGSLYELEIYINGQCYNYAELLELYTNTNWYTTLTVQMYVIYT